MTKKPHIAKRYGFWCLTTTHKAPKMLAAEHLQDLADMQIACYRAFKPATEPNHRQWA